MTLTYTGILDRWPIITSFITTGQYIKFNLQYNGYKYDPFNAYHAQFLLNVINAANGNLEHLFLETSDNFYVKTSDDYYITWLIDGIVLHRDSGIIPKHLYDIDIPTLLESVVSGELHTYFDHNDTPPTLIE